MKNFIKFIFFIFAFACGVKGPPQAPLVTAPELLDTNDLVKKEKKLKKITEPPPPQLKQQGK